MESLLIGGASMGGIAIILGAILSVAYAKLRVEEDPRVEEVNDLLPGANCAACGMAGCKDFAEKLVAGEIDVALCNVLSENSAHKIAALLGIEYGGKASRIARVFCGGGNAEATDRSEYSGILDCTAAILAGGGPKGCSYGCLGFATCVRACTFSAMYMNENGLPVIIEENCTACGKCVTACPKSLIELVDVRNEVIIRCKSQDKGAATRKKCTVGCIACTKCVKDCPHNAIEMQGNLAVMNFDKCENASICIGVCPAKTIVNVKTLAEEERQALAGKERVA